MYSCTRISVSAGRQLKSSQDKAAIIGAVGSGLVVIRSSGITESSQ